MKGSLPSPVVSPCERGFGRQTRPARGSQAEQVREGQDCESGLVFWGHPACGTAPEAGQPLWVTPDVPEHLAAAWDGSLGSHQQMGCPSPQPGQALGARAGEPGKGLVGHAPPRRNGFCYWGVLTQDQNHLEVGFPTREHHFLIINTSQAAVWSPAPVPGPSTAPRLMVPLTCLGKAALLHCNSNTDR